ncbi:MAG TPA: hypothetical protein VI076_07550, partial [Actinopolymorphaceae bacterium]
MRAVLGSSLRSRGSRLAVVGLAVLVLTGLLAWQPVRAALSDGPRYRIEDTMVTVPGGPGEPASIRLDTRTYVPETASARTPAPAVLLAHGFGGSKFTVADDAEDLAERGYLLLTWSARGFG